MALPPRPSSRVRIIELHQRPELASAALATLAAHPPGKHHLVGGLPHRMGLPPIPTDLNECLGVLCSVSATDLLGVVGLVPYSDEQATLWGPAAVDGYHAPVARSLLVEAKRILAKANYTSVRALVDVRNRDLRAFLLQNGFVSWKENHLFERALTAQDEVTTPIDLASAAELPAALALFATSFPEAEHDGAGYRHYVLSEGGAVVAAAAVRPGGRRSWLKLIAVDPAHRGRHLARHLLRGVCHHERVAGAMVLALEVLSDNRPAQALYASSGFHRSWAAMIMTAPV
jgi:ribosomal protein S18 acetylase RimI-like enzyme